MFERRTVHARIQKHLHTHTDIHRLLPPTHAGSNCIHNRSLAHTQDQLPRNCTHARARHRYTHGDMMTHSLASIHLLDCSFARKLLSSSHVRTISVLLRRTHARAHNSPRTQRDRKTCMHARTVARSLTLNHVHARIHTVANACT